MVVGVAEAAFVGSCDGRAERGEDDDVCGSFGYYMFQAFGRGHGERYWYGLAMYEVGVVVVPVLLLSSSVFLYLVVRSRLYE